MTAVFHHRSLVSVILIGSRLRRDVELRQNLLAEGVDESGLVLADVVQIELVESEFDKL